MCALRIVELRNKNILHLNVKEFAEITTRGDLANRSLAVISIAGAIIIVKFILKIIVKFIPVIPSTIIALGLHQTPLGKAVLGGCAIAKIILKHFDI